MLLGFCWPQFKTNKQQKEQACLENAEGSFGSKMNCLVSKESLESKHILICYNNLKFDKNFNATAEIVLLLVGCVRLLKSEASTRTTSDMTQ